VDGKPKKAAVKKRAPRRAPVAALKEEEDDAVQKEEETEAVVKKSWFATFWPYGIMIAIALVLIAVVFWQRRKPKPVPVDNTEVIRQKDSTIAALKRVAELEGESKEFHKKAAEELLNRPIQNKTYYVESKKKYDQVPDDVRTLNKRQLHAEITELTTPKDTP
jgi:hypothetical protein